MLVLLKWKDTFTFEIHYENEPDMLNFNLKSF